MPGQAEIEDDGVGPVALREGQRRLARARQVDRVASRAEVRGQRSQDLRLVVDDEDALHVPPRRRSTIVRPPPGVSSTSTVPPIASTKPARDGQPEPDAGALRAVAEALERDEHAVAIRSGGTPGPRSTTRRSTPPSTAPATTRTGAPTPCTRAFCDDVGDRALEQPGIRDDPGKRLRHVDVDLVRAGADAPERGRDDLVEADGSGGDLQGAGLEAAHVQQVADEPVEAVRLRIDRREEVLPVRLRPVDLVVEQRRHGRLDTGEGRAEVVRDGREDREPEVVDALEVVGLGGVRLELLDVDGAGELRHERVEQPALVVRDGRADECERVARVHTKRRPRPARRARRPPRPPPSRGRLDATG